MNEYEFEKQKDELLVLLALTEDSDEILCILQSYIDLKKNKKEGSK